MPKTDSPPEQFRSGWLDRLDGRYAMATELRQRYIALTNDLGGADRLSYAQRSLCERALWLEYWLASQERELARGGDFAVGSWVQAANSLQGIFTKLGLKRQAKDVPSLNEWMREREAAA